MAGRGRLAWRFDYAGSPKNPRIKSSATGRFKPLFTRRRALNKPFREYAIAAKIGCTPQTLRDWVRKAVKSIASNGLLVVLPVMAPSSQELEPPANPARFNPKFQTSLLFRVRQHV
jgi:hypothetical protein